MDRQEMLTLLDDLIEHGSGLVSHVYNGNSSSRIVAIVPDWLDDREFNEWRTRCLSALARLSRDNPELRQDVERFRSLAAQPSDRDVGVGILQGLHSALKKGTVSFHADDRAATPLDTVLAVLRRFHRFAREIQRPRRADKTQRPNYVVNDEYDVQHLMLALLRASFEDVRPEEWTPSLAGKSARMDFLLVDHEIVVEAKMTRPTLRDKEVGEELIDDKARYAKHGRCKTLICFVYDPQQLLDNPAALENDLREDGPPLSVRVLVVPRG